MLRPMDRERHETNVLGHLSDTLAVEVVYLPASCPSGANCGPIVANAGTFLRKYWLVRIDADESIGTYH